MTMITSKQRAYLRELANPISPIFQVGKGGVGDALRKQVEALRASARSYRDKLLQLLQQQRELLDQNSELF